MEDGIIIVVQPTSTIASHLEATRRRATTLPRAMLISRARASPMVQDRFHEMIALRTHRPDLPLLDLLMLEQARRSQDQLALPPKLLGGIQTTTLGEIRDDWTSHHIVQHPQLQEPLQRPRPDPNSRLNLSWNAG